MSSRQQVVERIAAVTGMNPMTVELILRYLAKAGLVPRGSPGKRSEHYSDEHLKNLVLALAAYQPNNAVNAVQLLAELRCNTNDLLYPHTFPSRVPKGTLFGDWITQEIRARVTRCEADYIVFD